MFSAIYWGFYLEQYYLAQWIPVSKDSLLEKEGMKNIVCFFTLYFADFNSRRN